METIFTVEHVLNCQPVNIINHPARDYVDALQIAYRLIEDAKAYPFNFEVAPSGGIGPWQVRSRYGNIVSTIQITSQRI